MRVSRRAFLKASGLAFSAALLPPTPPDEAPRPIFDLGRTTRTINVYDRPSFQANVVVLVGADTVFKIYSTVLSEEASYNPAWYHVRRGYVYSGHVQPVRWQLQRPSLEAPAKGFLGEITVPYSISKTWRNANAAWVYRLYYGTTYWMTAAEKDEEGRIWYQVYDERLGQYSWVAGEHVRRVSKEEVAPLSPNVQDKRIEISLEKQTFQCFENGAKVLDTLCSTGIYLRTEEGRRIYGTPAGDWAVARKRVSRHMAGDDAASADFFDLPGVPWVSYFHWWGISIHGTYWHNDYGAPHSHGCINLTPEDAKWVYRWTQPHAPLTQQVVEGEGTQVIVY